MRYLVQMEKRISLWYEVTGDWRFNGEMHIFDENDGDGAWVIGGF